MKGGATMPRKQALIFRDAEKARDSIMASQKEEIAELYKKFTNYEILFNAEF